MIEENRHGSAIINYYGEAGAQESAREPFERAQFHFSADRVYTAPAYRYTASADSRENHTLYFFKDGGKGYFRADGEVFHTGMGDALFVSAGKSVDFFPLVTEPWDFIRINVSGSFFEEILKTWQMPPVAYITEAYRIEPLFDKVETLMRERHMRYTTMTDQFALLFLEIIQTFTEAYYNITYRMAHPMAHAFRHALTNHPEKEFDNKGWANHFGCSVTTMVEIFRSSYGMTPHEYLTETRLEKAALMLRNSADPIEHIAETVGYSDARYFCRIFKKHYGQSPSEYRRAVGNSIRKSRRRTY